MARKTILLLSKSNVTSRTQQTGVFDNVIDILVPRTLAYRLPHGTPIVLYLYTRETFLGTGAPQNVVTTHDLLENPGQPDVNGNAYVYDITGAAFVVGYTVNYATNTVAGTFAANNHYVYYIFASLTTSDKLRIRAADAVKEHFVPLMNRDLRNWSLVNQNDKRQIQELRTAITLPEKTHLLFDFLSDVEMFFDANSPSYLEIPVEELSMSEVDASEFVRFT